jgi:hypothetical protein
MAHTQPRTEAQEIRQATRENGRYSTLHACELCGKGVGATFYSDDRCNEMGVGVTLHLGCARKLAKMSVEQVKETLKAK